MFVPLNQEEPTNSLFYFYFVLFIAYYILLLKIMLVIFAWEYKYQLWTF